MKRLFIALTILTISLTYAVAQQTQTQTQPKGTGHVMFSPDTIEWQDGPKSLPTGAKMAVLEGDPTKQGMFTMRLSAPAGFKIPPHWHPATERVTVISGSFNLGMGETFDESKGNKMTAGAFGYMPAKMRHFAWTDEETVIQVTGMGPWQINYVNPADDPRKK